MSIMDKTINLIYLTSDLDMAYDCTCASCGSEQFEVLNDTLEEMNTLDDYEIRFCQDCDTLTVIDYVNSYDAMPQGPILIKDLHRIES